MARACPAWQRLIDRASAAKMSDMGSVVHHDSFVDRARFQAEAGLSDLQFDQALRAKRFFAVELGGDEYIPEFFLDERYDRRQLQSVCKVLGDLPGGSKLQFFTTPKGSLNGQTPLDALMDRKVAAVRRTAQGFAER